MILPIQIRGDNGSLVVVPDTAMLERLRDPLAARLSDARVLVIDLDELTTPEPAGSRARIVAAPRRAPIGGRVATSRAATVASLAEARTDQFLAVHRTTAHAVGRESDGAVP